jgi:hypothetical protein
MQDEKVFINRNLAYFEMIVDFLSNETFPFFFSQEQKMMFFEEAKYWNMHESTLFRREVFHSKLKKIFSSEPDRSRFPNLFDNGDTIIKKWRNVKSIKLDTLLESVSENKISSFTL